MAKFLAAVAAVFFSGGCSAPVAEFGKDAQQTHSLAESKLAVVDIQGQEHRLFEEPDVRAVAVVFVMQDCPIANSCLPTLNRLSDAFTTRGVRMLLVHTDPKITLEEARRHAGEYEIRAAVVLDPQHAWVRLGRATKSPEVVVFSPDQQVLYRGRIDDQYVGLGKRRTEVTSHDLADALEAILAGRPVPQPVTEAIGCDIPELPSGD